MNQKSEVDAVVNILKKNGYTTYFTGEKCLVELHNKTFPEDKVSIENISILTNATPDNIIQIFENSTVLEDNPHIVIIQFGCCEFKIITYDDFNNCLEKQNFTVNAIVQDINDKFTDYTYVYHNRKISGLEDINNKIIRIIKNSKKYFDQDPLKLLHAFNLQSKIGYTIEPQTLKIIIKNLKLLKTISLKKIINELNEIILGKYAFTALEQMKEIGFFKIKVFDPEKNKNVELLPILNEFENFNELKNLSSKKNDKVATWAVIFRKIGISEMKNNLQTIHVLNDDDIQKVEWLIEHFDLINESNLKNAIYNARIKNLMYMRNLIQKLCKIHLSLDNSLEEKVNKLYFTFCAYPYFPEQLKLSDNELISLFNSTQQLNIDLVKDKLLYKLINSAKLIKSKDEYMQLATNIINEMN